MKILHVIPSVNPQYGGPIEGIRQLIPSLSALGIATEVMSLDAPDAPWTNGFPVPLHATGPSRFFYGYNARAVPWLKKHGTNYDALIVNGLWQYVSLATWLALCGTATPYYVYPHGMLDPWFKQHYPLKHLKKSLYWRLAEHRVLRDAAAVLFTSEEEKLTARDSFRPYHCHEEVTGYGITAPTGDSAHQRALFMEQNPGLNGKHLLLFLGRIHEKKGCDLLLRAWSEILTKPQIKDVHLVLAGPSDHAYGLQMQELTRKLGLEDKVTWTGMLSGDLKWGALHAADAFVLPSHQENFGVSVVEALACGVPALISNKVNIWREISDCHAGLVESDDLTGTVRLLDRWQQLDPTDKEEMRLKARQCFAQHFDMAKTAEKLALLFKR